MGRRPGACSPGPDWAAPGAPCRKHNTTPRSGAPSPFPSLARGPTSTCLCLAEPHRRLGFPGTGPGGRDLGVSGAANIGAADPKLLPCSAEANPHTHGRHPAFRHRQQPGGRCHAGCSQPPSTPRYAPPEPATSPRNHRYAVCGCTPRARAHSVRFTPRSKSLAHTYARYNSLFPEQFKPPAACDAYRPALDPSGSDRWK